MRRIARCCRTGLAMRARPAAIRGRPCPRSSVRSSSHPRAKPRRSPAASSSRSCRPATLRRRRTRSPRTSPRSPRSPASSHAAAVSMFPRLTTALGAGAIMLYHSDSAPDLTVVAAGTPVIVLGPRLAAEGDAVPRTELRALLARAVELTRPEPLAFAGLPARDATRLLPSVVRLIGPAQLRESVSALIVEEDVQHAHGEMVKGALPVKLRTRLEQLLAHLPAAALDNARYTAACHRDADRVVLFVGGV